MSDIKDIRNRNIYIVGVGPSGKTTTAHLIIETHGHRHFAAKGIGLGNDKTLVADTLKQGPIVVSGLRNGIVFARMFDPKRDVFVVLNREGVRDIKGVEPIKAMEELVQHYVAEGTMTMERVITATFNSMTSPKLRVAREKLGLTDAMKAHGYFHEGQ